MVKIYTRTGDDGETGLFGGGRVPKDDLRIEAYGCVDELNAVVGVARSELRSEPTRSDAPEWNELDGLLQAIQHDLFSIGAELATRDPVKHSTLLVGDARVRALETAIDRWESTLEPLTAFILPGGSVAAASLHVARTVCRRAERRTLSLSRTQPLADGSVALVYLNRLSDLLFVLARVANRLAGVDEPAWHPPTEQRG